MTKCDQPPSLRYGAPDQLFRRDEALAESAPLGATYKWYAGPTLSSSRSDIAPNGSVGVLYDLDYKDFAPAKRVARALEVRTPSRRGRGSNPDSAETRGA